MFNTVKTIYNNQLVNSKLINYPYIPAGGTTLNEKFNIVVEPGNQVTPDLMYYTIGLHYEDLVDTNVMSLDKVKHSPLDGALFHHIPFVAKRVSADLTAVEKEFYRLRVEKEVDGVMYALYYMKKFNIDTLDNLTVKIKNDNGRLIPNELVTENIPTILNPVPVNRDKLYGEFVDFIITDSKFTVSLSMGEVEYIKDAIDLLFPGHDHRIGEMGICSAVDVDINGIKEAAYTQINYFMQIDFDMDTVETNTVVLKTVDVGGLEQLAIPNV